MSETNQPKKKHTVLKVIAVCLLLELLGSCVKTDPKKELEREVDAAIEQLEREGYGNKYR